MHTEKIILETIKQYCCDEKRSLSPSASLSIIRCGRSRVALWKETMVIRAINHFAETSLWLLMNFSHATTNAERSVAARRSFCLQAEIWRHFSGTRDLKLFHSRQPLFCHTYCSRLHHRMWMPPPRPMRFFLSVGSWVWSVLMNERGVLWLSLSVFLGLGACGLCGLSHSDEPCGDILGHGLSWVGAHTESLTDAGNEEKGMFSYGEETRPDYGGERETERKGRWLCLNVCFCMYVCACA